jgi:bile acid-coenzyme A ligase
VQPVIGFGGLIVPAGGPRSTHHYIATPREDNAGWDSIGGFGWVDEDGYVFLADRRTDLIISGGANIHPTEVEADISIAGPWRAAA